MTKGAMGSLQSRYRAVLRKCRLKNLLAKMLLAGTAMVAAPLPAAGPDASGAGGFTFVKAAQAEEAKTYYSADGRSQDFARNENLRDTPQTGDAENSGKKTVISSGRTENYICSGLASSRPGLTGDGRAPGAAASNNELTLGDSGGYTFESVFIAGYAGNMGAGSSTADGNTLHINSAGIKLSLRESLNVGLAGGFAEIATETGEYGSVREIKAAANGNTVIIEGEKTDIAISTQGDSYIYGGKAAHGYRTAPADAADLPVSTAQADGNTVFLRSGAKVGRDVYAGYASALDSASAGNNTVEISGPGTVVLGGVTYGGYAQSGYDSYSDRVTEGSGTAQARGNTLNIRNAQYRHTWDEMCGGKAEIWGSGTALASDNKITLGDTETNAVFGGSAFSAGTGEAAARDNTLEIRRGTHLGGHVMGGYAYSRGGGRAFSGGNTVTVLDAKAEWDVFAGYTINEGSGTSAAEGNTLKVLGGEYVQDVAGSLAAATEGTASAGSNVVEVSGSQTLIHGSVHGGWAMCGFDELLEPVGGGSGAAQASGNTVTIRDARIETKEDKTKWVRVDATIVTAGHALNAGSGTAQASDNRLELTNAEIGADVYAGWAANTGSGSAEAKGNTLTLPDGGSVGGSLYGGHASAAPGSARAAGNKVNLTKAQAGSDVFAGHAVNTGSGEAAAQENGIALDGGTVSGSVYGGYASAAGNGAGAGSNAVTLNGSEVHGHVYGGYASAAGNGAGAGSNTVTLNGSEVHGHVYGGYAEGGSVSGNQVSVKDSTLRGGAEAGHASRGDASGNTIVVENSTILDRLCGGCTDDGSATGNTVTVLSGRVNAEVAGGWDDGTATDNTVTLYDAASFTGSNFYGGRSAGSSSDVFTGNTLNVHGQIQAASMQNFQNLHFFNVADHQASVDLSKSAVIGDGRGSMTNVSIENLKNQSGPVPEEYVLVHTPKASSSFTGTNLYVNGDRTVTIGPDGSYVPYSGTVANDGTMDNAAGSAGMTKSQTLTKGFLSFDVDYFIKNGQDLIARSKKDSIRVNKNTQNFTANRAASAELMDIGADFVADEGIDNALQASQCLPGEPCGAKAFMAVNGGYSTFLGGTTTTMSYGSLLAGLARQCRIGPMGYLAGVFFETGLGRFQSEYEPDDSRAIDSEGHDYYYGIGALTKLFLERELFKGLYVEGSVRYGLMTSDWQSHDIQVNGRNADWDGRDLYLTAHGGLGYMWDVTDNVTADVYAKYFWGRLWGDDGSICGQKFEFDDIYSSRVRAGGRLNFKKDDSFSWYLGGAWEREFDMKSRATLYGSDVPSTNYRGNTAMAEAGIYVKPGQSDFSFTLGATGYFGEKREGVTGHLQVRYEF